MKLYDLLQTVKDDQNIIIIDDSEENPIVDVGFERNYLYGKHQIKDNNIIISTIYNHSLFKEFQYSKYMNYSVFYIESESDILIIHIANNILYMR